MSTIDDFENAPAGATAIREVTGRRALKMSDGERRWVTQNGVYLADELMAQWGYMLDHPAPTTAREAIDLAWELAHPVKEGQAIPKGIRYLRRRDGETHAYTARYDFERTSALAPEIRTLDPLPDPEPDWLDAPAVVAWSRWDDVRREKVWSKADECYKSTDGEIIDWSDLRDVTPLYPKEQDA